MSDEGRPVGSGPRGPLDPWLTRREWLFAAGAALVHAGLASACGVGPGEAASPMARALRETRRDPAAAAAVGQRCLEVLEAPPPRDALVAALAGDALTPATPVEVIRRHLRERHRADFAEGRTVEVDGWILSRTEAQLYMLLAGADDPARPPAGSAARLSATAARRPTRGPARS